MDDEQVLVLNFAAKLISRNRDDALRKFVISFYLYDQTLAIYEELVQNSGFRHGKYLQKTRIRNPDTKTFFAPSDFFVGAKITVAGRKFELLAASELALGLMEASPDDFPESDLSLVIAKFKAVIGERGENLRQTFEEAAKERNGRLLTEAAKSIINRFVPAITQNAAATLVRGFDRNDWYAYEDLLKLLRL
jgi:hypothetical protein